MAGTQAMAYLIWISCTTAVLVVLLPSIMYLLREWGARRDRLFAALTPAALRSYYLRFFPTDHAKLFTPKRPRRIILSVLGGKLQLSLKDVEGLIEHVEDVDPQKADKVVSDHFRKEFGRLYGRRHYVFPLILLAVVSGLGMWATAETIKSWLGVGTRFSTLPPIVITSFLGAYAWVLLDQFSRYQSRNFTKHNVYNGVYRFLVAVPLGFSFAALLKEDVGVPLAFLLGAFPTQTLMKFSRRLVVDKWGLGEKEKEGPTELAKLQGIGRENAERFQYVDITTIVQLAWADPVELTIRTNFEFSFIIDCISQALVWIYFEDDTKKLYPFSLRGSQEVRYLCDVLESDNEIERAQGRMTLAKAGEALSMDSESLMQTLRAISEDPYTELICRIWIPENLHRERDSQ